MLAWPDKNSYIKWSDDSYGDLYMPIPSTPPTIKYTNNESISLSEAGTEIGTITRLEKKVIQMTWILGSDWYEQIERKCLISLSSIVMGTHSALTVRARLLSANLLKKSEWLSRTDGLWSITVQFTEV